MQRHCLHSSRSWEEGGVRYLQRAASTPVTRLEVVALQERLDRALQERQVPKPWPYTISYLECPPGHLKYLLCNGGKGQ